MTIYFDPNGGQIKAKAWAACDPDDYIMERFENEHIAVWLRRVRFLVNGRDIPEHFWKRFEVEVVNIRHTCPEGEPLARPVRTKDPMLSRAFTDESVARGHYLSCIETFAKAEVTVTKEGEIKGGGNIYEPPDPNVPTYIEGNDLIGSW